MKNTEQLYILVADNGRAKIFRGEIPLEHLEIVFEDINSKGRQKLADFYSDKAGTQQSGSGGFHSFAGERQSNEEEKYSRQLCHLLHKEHQAGKFNKLILIAPPHLLGNLRKHLERDCYKALTLAIDKDLTALNEKEILEKILEYQPNPDLSAMKVSGHKK